MRPRASSAATDGVASEALEDHLLAGGSALSAVLAGYFALVGEHPNVFAGPLSLLLYGFGAARALDGRARQPGLGAKRPRGALQGQPVPDVARVSVPMGWKAALVALGYDRDRRLAQIFKSGLSRARSLGATGRVRLLEALRDGGAGAFSDPLLHRPWLHLAAPGQGGLLTAADFTSVPDIDRAALRIANDSGVTLCAPWEAESSEHPELGVIAAIDPGGMAAILCYEQPTAGVELPGWDLMAATLAAPVRRGSPRVKPGTALPAAAPIRLELDGSNRVVGAVSELHGRTAFRVGL